MEWPLRRKLTALLIVASLLPLIVASWVHIRAARQRLLVETEALLAARGDELAEKMDAFNAGYQRWADTVARLPDVVGFSSLGAAERGPRVPLVRQALLPYPAGDAGLRGLALLDSAGTVLVATEATLEGEDLSGEVYVRPALLGRATISDIYVAGASVGSVPTIAYVAPVRDHERQVVGLVVFWARAAALWSLARASNDRAGPGSFAVVFDQLGIRVAHTYNDDIVFHPAGTLPAATVDTLVAESRFGARTRAFLDDVRAFPDQFDRARAASPDRRVFRGFAPVNRQFNYGVARRLTTVPWTVFYMVPEVSLVAATDDLTRWMVVFASVIVVAALVVGSLFAALIVRPIDALSTATEAFAAGDLAARVAAPHGDELGQLGATFNDMAARIGAQANALLRSHAEIERRVEERTAALRESESRLGTTLDSIGDAVIATDVDGRVTRMNPVAAQLTGWSRAEAMGRALTEVFDIRSEDTREPLESPVARVLREGVVVGLANHTELCARDGSIRPIADSGAPIRDVMGVVRGVVLVFRDQSAERQLEALRTRAGEVEADNLRFKEASRMKSEFLANMSHELRTPLNAIIGFSELLFRKRVPSDAPEHQEFLGDILTSARHLLRLINDILDLSKVEAGKLDFYPEPLVLADVVGEVASILHPMAATKEIALTAELAPDLVGLVLDPARLKQILYNYVSNALKFTRNRGSVIVRARSEPGDAFRIEVEDNGPGIASADLGRLFVVFEQLDSGSTKRQPGTGLGLALTKRLVEAQGGLVGVRTEPGTGSVFYAVLPRVHRSSSQ